MLQGWVIIFTSFAYLGLLFAIAYYADKRAEAGRSVIGLRGQKKKEDMR